MTSQKLFLWLCLSIVAWTLLAQPAKHLSLNDGWQFVQSGKTDWLDAEVPGSVQRDLIRHGILPDPYYGTNETKIQWVEDEDWDYRKSFTLTQDDLQHRAAMLVFEGLDTHADVFLNGSRIIRSENMFVKHEVNVQPLLREGENNLYIRFSSPIKVMNPARLTLGYEYPAGNDHRDEKVSIYNRKAPYHFGWDWGIRIVQMGIWKPVRIEWIDDVRINDYFVKQNEVNEHVAKVDNQIELFSFADTAQDAQLSIRYTIDNESKTERKTFRLLPGENKVSLPLDIHQPKRWMPVNWGKQHLYDFTAEVTVGNKIVAQTTERIGLRSVRLVQEKDQHGQSFYFEVNGKPFFAKGSNYIPGEILTTQQDKAYYTKLFDNVQAANMNFIRVWGGGIYENDEFYRQADERGILVWQDFIFGCVPYPSDEAFLKNVETELIQNIKRLRNHASLAFWCGNNEVEESLLFWGWDKEYPKQVMDNWHKGYNKTFREFIPAILAQYDGTRSYIHGSPYIPNWGKPETFAMSDVHDWGLWYGHLPFEALADRLPRFASEFGFQSFPEMKVIRSFATEDQWSLESDVMKIHQKASTGNSLIKKYMDMYYHEPSNFEDFVYVGLVMQGNGMEESVEAMRRGRPYCMGSLYWQINDSWPVVSWSSIDYYGNWKTMHYRMRNVLAPLAVGMKLNGTSLDFYTLSDYLTDTKDLILEVQVVDFNKGKQQEFRQKVVAQANSSEIVWRLDADTIIPQEQRRHMMVRAFLKDAKGAIISSKDYFFYWPNQLDLPQPKVTHRVKYADGTYTVTLKSDKLAKDVFVEIPTMGAQFSDNFVNLLPGETKVITITSPQLRAKDKTPINIRHIRQTYK